MKSIRRFIDSILGVGRSGKTTAGRTAERSGDAPPEIGGTEDAIEAAAAKNADSGEPERSDEPDPLPPAPEPAESSDSGGD